MGDDEIRRSFETGELTWGDLLEITGLHPTELFDLLYDLLNKPIVSTPEN